MRVIRLRMSYSQIEHEILRQFPGDLHYGLWLSLGQLLSGHSHRSRNRSHLCAGTRFGILGLIFIVITFSLVVLYWVDWMNLSGEPFAYIIENLNYTGLIFM